MLANQTSANILAFFSLNACISICLQKHFKDRNILESVLKRKR